MKWSSSFTRFTFAILFSAHLQGEAHTSLFSSHGKLVRAPGRQLGALRPSDYYKRKETRTEESRNDAGTLRNLETLRGWNELDGSGPNHAGRFDGFLQLTELCVNAAQQILFLSSSWSHKKRIWIWLCMCLQTTGSWRVLQHRTLHNVHSFPSKTKPALGYKVYKMQTLRRMSFHIFNLTLRNRCKASNNILLFLIFITAILKETWCRSRSSLAPLTPESVTTN
jgi:hypothetical protein